MVGFVIGMFDPIDLFLHLNVAQAGKNGHLTPGDTFLAA
jgi:hypothetical protein